MGMMRGEWIRERDHVARMYAAGARADDSNKTTMKPKHAKRVRGLAKIKAVGRNDTTGHLGKGHSLILP
jgi:hypothetical protein